MNHSSRKSLTLDGRKYLQVTKTLDGRKYLQSNKNTR